MKRQTARAHMFRDGQTIFYGGRGLKPAPPMTLVFTRSGRRVMLRSDSSPENTVTLRNFDQFWAAPAVPDGEALLVELADVYRAECFGTDGAQPHLAFQAGMARMLTAAVQRVRGLTAEQATAWVIELSDYYPEKDDRS